MSKKKENINISNYKQILEIITTLLSDNKYTISLNDNMLFARNDRIGVRARINEAGNYRTYYLDRYPDSFEKYTKLSICYLEIYKLLCIMQTTNISTYDYKLGNK